MNTANRNPVRDATRVLDERWSDSAGDYALPIDPIHIARSLGAEVYLATLPLGEAGRLVIEGNATQPKIYLSRDNGPKRQRFTCAHEVGHLVDRLRKGETGTYIDFRDGRSSTGTDPDEVYANQFAAELLMPRQAIIRDRDSGMTQVSMAERYGVSEAAMGFRLANLSGSR